MCSEANGPHFSGDSVEIGRWHHLAATSEWGVTTLYLDGVAVGSSSIFFDTAPGTDRMMGYLDDSRKQRGAIDELSVYGRALSAEAIQAIYRAGVAGKIKPAFRLNPPLLSTGTLTLSWNGGPGIKLQKTTSLANPSWEDVAGSDGLSQMELPCAMTAAFFRLVKP